MGGSGSKVGLEGVLGGCRNGAKGRVDVYSKCAIRARHPAMTALHLRSGIVGLVSYMYRVMYCVTGRALPASTQQ